MTLEYELKKRNNSNIPVYCFKQKVEIDTVEGNNYTIERNKKFYVAKGVDFSRHNLKMLCENFDGSTTRDIHKADYIILNPIYNSKNYYTNFEYISKRYFSGYKKYESIHVYEEDILQIIASKAVKISVNAINTILFNNREMPIIDVEQYKVLKSMFEGNSYEDIHLAVSLITNCNLHKSMYYVYKLICKYKWYIRNSKLHNSIKFKTLMVFYNETDILDFDENKIFLLLKEKNALTVYNLNAMMFSIKSHINSYIENKYNIEDIIVNLSITDELKNQVLQNEVNPNQLSLFNGKTE